jgi:hypothetical protein
MLLPFSVHRTWGKMYFSKSQFNIKYQTQGFFLGGEKDFMGSTEESDKCSAYITLLIGGLAIFAKI